MIGFFTSRPIDYDRNTVYVKNQFLKKLKEVLPYPCRALFVCSDPNHPKNQFYCDYVFDTFDTSGIKFAEVKMLCAETETRAAELVQNSDFIFITGGHVPTQNKFFERIGLREIIKDFDGVVVGLSAGSMNSADEVYSQPEEPGESISKEYKRFLHGLGLIKTCILPHYQDLKNQMLDGKRLFEDITYPDSFGRKFVVLPDGSYIYSDNGQETVYGESYLLADGVMTKLCDDGKTFIL